MVIVNDYLKAGKTRKMIYNGMGFRGSEVQILSSRPMHSPGHANADDVNVWFA